MKIRSILLVMLVLCLTLCLCACGGDDGSAQNNEQTHVASDVQTTAPTVPGPTQPVDGKANYTIKVVDAAGTPVAGAMVQMCDDTTCLIPKATGADGVAVYEGQEVFNYSVKFATVPTGYILPVGADNMPTSFYFAEGTYELTLTLEAAN